MKAKKHIYMVHLSTSFGIGAQPTKGDTKKDAIARCKKRYPKKRIWDADKIDPSQENYSFYKRHAI